MSVYQMFPLLAISVIVYAVITMTGVGDVETAAGTIAWYDVTVTDLKLVSGDIWKVTWGAIFLVASMGLLFVELVRATQTGTESIANHLLSFLLFIGALLLFIMVPGYGNTTFFIFLTMTFLDPMAGFIVTTVTARRDFAVTEGVGR